MGTNINLVLTLITEIGVVANNTISSNAYAQTFAHVGEYAKTIDALIPNTHVTSSNETIGILHLLHPFTKVDLLPFIDDFHPKIDITLNQKAFISMLVDTPPKLLNGFKGESKLKITEE